MNEINPNVTEMTTTAPVDTAATQVPTQPNETSTADVNAFYNSLPESLRQYKTLNKFDSVDKLADAYVNASKLIGKRVQDLSPEEIRNILPAEDMANMYKHMGVPTTADEYELPEGIDTDIAKFVKNKAHELGIPKDKLGQIIGLEQEVNKMAQEKLQDNWRSDVFTKYGKDFEPAIKMAQSAVKEFGGAELQGYLNQTGLGDHPAMVDMFVKIGQMMKEDKIPHTGVDSRATGGDVQNEIRQLLADKAFYAKWRDGDAVATAKLNELYVRKEKLGG